MWEGKLWKRLEEGGKRRGKREVEEKKDQSSSQPKKRWVTRGEERNGKQPESNK